MKFQTKGDTVRELWKMSFLLVVLIIRPLTISNAQQAENPVRISLMTDKARYTNGESIFLLVQAENPSSDPINLVIEGGIELGNSREDSIPVYKLQCVDCMDFRRTLLPGASGVYGFNSDVMLFLDDRNEKRIKEGHYSMVVRFRIELPDGEVRRIVGSNDIQVYIHPDISRSEDSLWVWLRRFGKEDESKWREEYSRIESQEADAVLRNSIVSRYYSVLKVKRATGRIPVDQFIIDLSDYIDRRPNDVLSGYLFLALSRNRHLDAFYAARKSYMDSSNSLIAKMVRGMLANRRK